MPHEIYGRRWQNITSIHGMHIFVNAFICGLYKTRTFLNMYFLDAHLCEYGISVITRLHGLPNMCPNHHNECAITMCETYVHPILTIFVFCK